MVTNVIYPHPTEFPHKDCGTHGMGRMGADFWPVLADKRGRKSPLCGRYPETGWGQLRIDCCGAFFLCTARDGPIGRAQLEMFRESAQDIEARVFVEKALEDEAGRAKLGEELATRARRLLDNRTRLAQLSTRGISASGAGSWKYADWRGILALGVQEHSEELYALAAEVAGKLGK
jgi:hypothetical protein